MRIEEYLEGAKAYVWKESFVIVKAKGPNPKAFVNIADHSETTVIIDESLLSDELVIEMERDWRVITLDVVLPMNVVGVTARIATAFADAGVTIMPIAAYSRDHFLVRNDDLERALDALKGIGIEAA